MSNKFKIDNLIIFLSFALCVFHTFTYLEIYYNFTVTVVMFAIILFLYVANNKGEITSDNKRSLLFLYLTVGTIIIVSILIKDNGFKETVGAYAPFIIWPTLYGIVNPIMPDKIKRRFIFAFLCFFAISVLATLSVVMTDNNAARLLAGVAKGELRYSYYRRGVGGYGFVYGSVFTVYGIILLAKIQSNKLVKILLFSLVVITSIMIVFASYTTALLMLLLIFVLSLYARSKHSYSTIVFLLSIILIVLLLNPILTFIHEKAEDLNLYYIANRVGQLLEAESSGSLEGLRRTMLYRESIESFLSNPWLGSDSIGGHSMFFDNIGSFGMFGVIFVLSFVIMLNAMRKKIGTRKGLIYFLVVALLMVNPIDPIALIPVIMFALPMMLSLTVSEAKEEKSIANRYY